MKIETDKNIYYINHGSRKIDWSAIILIELKIAANLDVDILIQTFAKTTTTTATKKVYNKFKLPYVF